MQHKICKPQKSKTTEPNNFVQCRFDEKKILHLNKLHLFVIFRKVGFIGNDFRKLILKKIYFKKFSSPIG